MAQAKLKALVAISVMSIGITFTGNKALAQKTTQQPQQQFFPDEYSDLDERRQPQQNTGTGIIRTKLDKALQKYLRALTSIEKADTVAATRLFEEAIESLNDLASYPGIEQNQDFADLAQSIIEDYESYIENIDNLPETSSAFLLREKIYQEVESFPRDFKPSVRTFKLPEQRIAGAPGLAALTIPLDYNEHVEKNLAFLTQDKGRKFFRKWLERSSRWFPMMKRIAREEHMPEEIVFLAMTESALNPNAVSWAKAVGMWQFTQAAATDYGLVVNSWLDERRDPEKATRAAMRYLKSLYNEFGDWHIALAAYNCGPNGAVRRALAKVQADKPTFWDIRDMLPRETKNYVPLYIATTIIGMNPEEYGFKTEELNFEPEFAYDLYPVSEAVSLKALARCLQQPVENIKSLNPELLNVCTPPDAGTPYMLRIPFGMKDIFAANYATLSDEEKRPWLIHEVKKGETLASIASSYGIQMQDVLNMNQLPSGKKIRKGMALRIPTDAISAAQALAAARAQQNAATIAQQSTDSTTVNPQQTSNLANSSIPETSSTAMGMASRTTNTVPPVATAVQQRVTTRSALTHMVKAGETLYSIAQRYGVRLTDLRTWNSIPFDSDNLRAGDELIVAADAAPEQAKKDIAKAQPGTHKVKKGETLAQIADDYGIELDVLRKANKLGKAARLLAGQSLTIPGSNNVQQNIAVQKAESQNAIEGAPLKMHTVKPGETIGRIAAMYNLSENDVQSWNPGLVPTRMLAGQKIKLYTNQSAKGSAIDTPSTSALRLPKHYKVRKGDTLASIADKFGLSLAQLKTMNKALKSANQLQIGQTLQLQ